MKSKRTHRGLAREQRHPKSIGLCPRCGTALASNGSSCTNCGAEIGVQRFPNPEAQRIQYTPSPILVGEKVLTFKEAHEVECKHVTILIADVADYASIAERLNPEEQYSLVSHYLTAIREEVTRYGGTMTQTRRGTVKAVFGAPQALERHARRACEAALSLLKTMADYSAKLAQEMGLGLSLRIGLASGLILSGSVPNGADMELEELEELEDVIPKLQAVMKPGVAIVAGSTYSLASDSFEFKLLKDVEQRQRDHFVEMYELLRPREFPGPIDSAEARKLSQFVGREREMAMLLNAADEAMAGSGRALGIVGDAGVGKSRLVYEFKKCLSPGTVTWLNGDCRSYDVVPPYQPFLHILKSSFDIKPREEEASSKRKIREKLKCLADSCEEIMAPLHEMLALTVDDESYLALGFGEKQERIFTAVESIFLGETQEKPLIVLLDDLHWIDRTSEDLLAYLVEKITDSRVLIIALYRPEYEGSSRFASAFREIRLDELKGEEVAQLTSSILGVSEVDADLIDTIQKQTAGNPLFIEEFTKSLLESGEIQKVDNRFLLKKGAQTSLLPKTVQSVISARIDRLETEVKLTLQVASVIGREFQLRLLERVRKGNSGVGQHIERLKQLQFIYERASSTDREFVFKHALTQETAYKGMSSLNRRLIHQEVGAAIEEMFSERIEDVCEQLAAHFSRAGNPQKGVQYLRLSAIKAQKQNSPWEAYGFAKEALRVLEAQPTNQENHRQKIEVLAVLNQIIRMLVYAPEDSEDIMKMGEKLCTEIDDQKELSLFRAALCTFYLAMGDANSCRRYWDFLSKEIQTLGGVSLTKDQLKILVPIAFEHSLSGLLGRFRDTLSVNLSVLKAMEETQTVSEKYQVALYAYPFLAAQSGLFSAVLGDFDNALILCDKSLNVAQRVQDDRTISWAEFYYGMVLNYRGHGEQAKGFLEKSIRRWKEAEGASTWSAALVANQWGALGYANFLQGNLEDAQRYLETGIKIQIEAGLAYYLSYAYANLGMVNLETGDAKRAYDCVEKAAEWSQKCGEKHWEGLSKMLRGKILGATELLQAARAESSILEGIEILNGFGMQPYCAQGYLYLGELYLQTGRVQLAANNLKRAERMFRKMGMNYWPRKAEEALKRLQSSRGSFNDVR